MKVTTGFLPQRPADEEDSREHFERVYFDHVDALFQYGTKFRANRELVEDCVQELFADLWEKKEVLGTIRSMRSYLLGALRRKILRRIYSHQEQLLEEDAMFTFLHQYTVESETFDAEPSEKAVKQLTEAFRQLTHKQQEVLYLRFYNQLSFQEIAGIMSVQTRTVYKLAHRSIAALRHYFSDSLQVVKALLLLVFY